MKILVLSFYYEPDLCAGSFRCTALVKQLQKINGASCKIEVITTLPNRYASFSVDALDYEQRDNVDIHRVALPTHKSGMIDQIFAFFRYYRETIKLTKTGDYDLVVATSSRLFTAFLGARIAKRKKIPLYLDIRDIFVDTLQNVLSPKLSRFVLPVLKKFEQYTFSNVAKVNLVSAGFSDYFEQRYPSLQYEFFTNGIDEEFINLKQPAVNNASSKTVKTILYAGNIGEGQGLHRIIPQLALQLGPEFQIKVVGDGGRKQQLVDAINDAGVKNVNLLPPVNRQELISHYQQADILFLHLNDYDAFRKVLPSKIFEYAAFDKPILAGIAGYSAEFVESHVDNANVFEPCNAVAAVGAISTLSYATVPRTEFVEKFRRLNIMEQMARSIENEATVKEVQI